MTVARTFRCWYTIVEIPEIDLDHPTVSKLRDDRVLVDADPPNPWPCPAIACAQRDDGHYGQLWLEFNDICREHLGIADVRLRLDDGQTARLRLTPDSEFTSPTRDDVEAVWTAIIAGRITREAAHVWTMPFLEALAPIDCFQVERALQQIHGYAMSQSLDKPGWITHWPTQGNTWLRSIQEISEDLEEWRGDYALSRADPDEFHRCLARRRNHAIARGLGLASLEEAEAWFQRQLATDPQHRTRRPSK